MLTSLTVVIISQCIHTENIKLYTLNTIFICQLYLDKAETKPNLTRCHLFLFAKFGKPTHIFISYWALQIVRPILIKITNLNIHFISQMDEMSNT